MFRNHSHAIILNFCAAGGCVIRFMFFPLTLPPAAPSPFHYTVLRFKVFCMRIEHTINIYIKRFIYLLLVVGKGILFSMFRKLILFLNHFLFWQTFLTNTKYKYRKFYTFLALRNSCFTKIYKIKHLSRRQDVDEEI